MFKKLTANLMVTDVQKTVAFYTEVLGFSYAMGVAGQGNEVLMENDPARELIYALVKQGSVEIMFQSSESLSSDIEEFAAVPIGGSVSFYIEAEDVERIYNGIKDRVRIVKDIHTTWYGMREFYFADPNGYVLAFASQVQQSGDTSL